MRVRGSCNPAVRPSSDPLREATFSHKWERGVALLFILFNLLALSLFFSPALAESPPLPVVASFSIIGDFAREVGGSGVDFPPSSAPMATPMSMSRRPPTGEARGSAAGFCQRAGVRGLDRAADQGLEYRARIVTLSAGVASRKDENGLDPHAWQDVENASNYVEDIGAGLSPPTRARGAMGRRRLSARLAPLDPEIALALENIPRERRSFPPMTPSAILRPLRVRIHRAAGRFHRSRSQRPRRRPHHRRREGEKRSRPSFWRTSPIRA